MPSRITLQTSLFSFPEIPPFGSDYLVLFLKDARPDNSQVFVGLVVGIRFDKTHTLYGPQPTLDPSEYGMLAVKPGCGRQCYAGQSDARQLLVMSNGSTLQGTHSNSQELATICIWPTICHTENAGARMLQIRVDLVFELLAVNR